MGRPRKAPVECMDCKVSPDRPKKPRPIDPRSTPRRQRCTTHWLAANPPRAAECVDCKVSPNRPQPPRPIDPKSGPRKPRCTTHRRAATARRKAKAHAARTAAVYGLEPEVYWALYEFQGGKCAIPRCRATGKARRLAVDHDHDTGEVRGLLCGPHNYELLGKYVNDLQDALDYRADPPMARLKRNMEEAG